MKKTISILIITLLVFCMTSCETEKKSDTVYVEWFGATIDLSNIDKYFPMYGEGIAKSLEDTIDYYVEKKMDFAVLRLKCTGNWIQKKYDEEHFQKHSDIKIHGHKMYMEIPFEVIDILEGNENLTEKGSSIQLEIPNMYVLLKNNPYDECEKEPNFFFEYDEAYSRFEYPRIGYEYVVIVTKSSDGDCLRANIILCELSTPKEQYEIALKLRHYQKPGDNVKVDYDEYVAEKYYEVLERYNIKVK